MSDNINNNHESVENIFNAFLMGEYFMKNENPGNKFKEFVDEII